MNSAANTAQSLDTPASADRDAQIVEVGRSILARECDAIGEAKANLGTAFVEAVDLILNCSGRLAVTGMGKAGLVGRKIQATFASTATRAYSLHPAEAIHGDLGMICAEDAILALTNSGETQELVRLLPTFRKMGCKIMLITGRPKSTCAKLSDIVLDIGATPEACPLQLAPSSSTTAMLAVGDALALTVMQLRDVAPEEYAAFHPGGALGRSLMRVREIMRTGDDCPTLESSDTIGQYDDAVQRAPRRAGAAAIVDGDKRLVGFFTHGDFVRCARDHNDWFDLPISDVMTKNPKSARVDDLVADAIKLIQKHKIDELPVVDENHQLVGLIDVQDLLAAGFSSFDEQS
ncbi:MAG: arabinose-5-phosphate isomerase [Phycisphaerae bacterium]|nr:MAG: arabinose-5-phosphate isomerase [Phycisphaerae bacterium]